MIIKKNLPTCFDGCDSVVVLNEDRRNTKIRLLQITDMQFIDSSQMRTPDRLREDEIVAWNSNALESQCGAHIRSLITQAKPDVILITGDIVYGQFDDSGKVFEWFCDFMDSFQIPWAPVYGNHDNESKKGVAWQNQKFENSEYCLFKTGNVTGNGNYTVGIAVGEQLLRVLYMADSNGCAGSDDKMVTKNAGIYPDQLKYFNSCADKIENVQGNQIPAFMGFHIPTKDFDDVMIKKGYAKEQSDLFVIGVDCESKDGDFGFKLEKCSYFETDGFVDFLKRNDIKGVFVGHDHSISTCINYDQIKWVFGLKTGQYDYHVAGNVGGTLITLEGDNFDVLHIPSLVNFAPYPFGANMHKDYFVKLENSSKK